MSKPKHRGAGLTPFVTLPKRTEAESILENMEIARENAELKQMNGIRCGNRQAYQLSYYRRPQKRQFDAKEH
jgi:hypothetical protein